MRTSILPARVVLITLAIAGFGLAVAVAVGVVAVPDLAGEFSDAAGRSS